MQRMKTFSIIAIFLTLLSACKKSDCKDCIVPIVLGEVFTVEHSCSYQLINNTDTIIIQLSSIHDNRTFGAACAVSTGGNASVELLVNNDNIEFNYPGCDGEMENDPSNPFLPLDSINSLELKMIKLYPLSENLNSIPDLEDYQVRLIIR